MKLAGHTMATPESTVPEAIKMFSGLGLDGVEIVIQSDYKSGIPYEATDKEVKEIGKMVTDFGMKVCCITPYYSDYNNLDENIRIKEVDNLKRVIDMAYIFNAPSIRIYGGAFKDSETDEGDRKLFQLVKSLSTCGDYAASAGTNLAIENHFGTMATTVERTMRVIKAIEHKNVGILYDQANLAFFPAEEYTEAIPTQIDYIKHVHVKDLAYKGGKPQKFQSDMVTHISEEIRTVFSKIPGDGILNWPVILKCLKDHGYDGWLSLEYERRWGKQDLPIASEGMPINVKRLRKWMNEL
jgi:L-ribulose-5-phosphate 3-epimerase